MLTGPGFSCSWPWEVAADLGNSFRGHRLGHIGLELAEDLGDTKGHPWPPVGMSMG